MASVPELPIIACELAVFNCPSCHGDHERILFEPCSDGSDSNHTHKAVCPATQKVFWMDTQSSVGVWDRLLEAAGIVAR